MGRGQGQRASGCQQLYQNEASENQGPDSVAGAWLVGAGARKLRRGYRDKASPAAALDTNWPMRAAAAWVSTGTGRAAGAAAPVASGAGAALMAMASAPTAAAGWRRPLQQRQLRLGRLRRRRQHALQEWRGRRRCRAGRRHLQPGGHPGRGGGRRHQQHVRLVFPAGEYRPGGLWRQRLRRGVFNLSGTVSVSGSTFTSNVVAYGGGNPDAPNYPGLLYPGAGNERLRGRGSALHLGLREPSHRWRSCHSRQYSQHQYICGQYQYARQQ